MLILALTLAAAAPPDFDKDVLPVFAKYCFGCHAAGIRMGSFECDSYDAVMRGATHGAVVVPGKSAESRLYQSLTGELSPAMPLTLERLTADELAIIRAWIDSGAARKSKPKASRGNLRKWEFRTSSVTGSLAQVAKPPLLWLWFREMPMSMHTFRTLPSVMTGRHGAMPRPA